MYAPFTPIEFFDASFHDGSEHFVVLASYGRSSF
jgi:hypothetical protein